VVSSQADPRRLVPRTDSVLADDRLQAAIQRIGTTLVKQAISRAQQLARSGQIAPDQVTDTAVAALPDAAASLRPVFNATGVVLHTNLGRATLSRAAGEALSRAAGPTDVEFDLTTGNRAPRGRGALAALRHAVPAAESVAVVNNGAAALLLATTTLAAGRDVVISRGEMIEIGDGFRLPALITSAGARLREVGTTNRTTIRDYRQAIDDQTGCIVKVHPSNFRIEGFTSAVPVDQLAKLGVPVVADIGSGLLAPDPLLPDEPDADTALRAGAGLVTASGDKLLGGPQAGLLLGADQIVGQLRRHPMFRALRVDKLTLAALEATLAGPVSPTWQQLRADPETLRRRAAAVVSAVHDRVLAELVRSDGMVGGGGAPGQRLPGWAVALPTALAAPLRTGDPPIVGRIDHDRLLIDVRCIPPDADETITAAIRAMATKLSPGKRPACVEGPACGARPACGGGQG
jgi:L-seryl-tRNA(Ser) seleniumtransferase